VNDNPLENDCEVITLFAPNPNAVQNQVNQDRSDLSNLIKFMTSQREDMISKSIEKFKFNDNPERYLNNFEYIAGLKGIHQSEFPRILAFKMEEIQKEKYRKFHEKNQNIQWSEYKKAFCVEFNNEAYRMTAFNI